MKTNNVDLNNLLAATVDSVVMRFIDVVGEKYELNTQELCNIWDKTSVGGTIKTTKRKIERLEDSESSSASEKKTKKPVDDGTESEEESVVTVQNRKDSLSESLSPVAKKPSKHVDSSDDESPVKPKGKKQTKVEESESEDTPVKPKGKGKKQVKVEESESEDTPVKPKGKKPVEDSSDDESPVKPKGKKQTKVELSESDESPVKPKGKKPVEDSDDDTPVKPKAKGKKQAKVEESESEDTPVKPKGKGKKQAKVEESDDESPVKPKEKAKPKAKGKGERRDFVESDQPKGGSDFPDPPSNLKFLEGTNYVVHDGKVVAGWGKRGITALSKIHVKALDGPLNENIKYEVYSKEKLNKLLDMEDVNAGVKKGNVKAKKGKK